MNPIKSTEKTSTVDAVDANVNTVTGAAVAPGSVGTVPVPNATAASGALDTGAPPRTPEPLDGPVQTVETHFSDRTEEERAQYKHERGVANGDIPPDAPATQGAG